MKPPSGNRLARPLDSDFWRDPEAVFHHVTEHHGSAAANGCLSFLCPVYRRPCVDHEYRCIRSNCG